MTQKPTVSVCMITYNHEKFIQEAIEGVLMQQCDFEIELILANDCSTDKTDEVIQEIIKTHPRSNWIKYTNHSKNKGMMPNFIWALQQCKGKYIALCEGDDYWTDSSKLQKQVDFLEGNQEYIVCYHDVNVIDEKGNQSSNSLLGQWKKDYSEVELKKGAWLPTLTRCFRNMNFIFPSEFYKVAAGDHFLTGILGLYGKAKYLDFNGGNYRIHKNGAWNSKNIFDSNIAMLNDYIILIKFWKNKKDKEVYNFYKSSIKNTNEKLIEICMKNNKIIYFYKVMKTNLVNYKILYDYKNFKLVLRLVKKKVLIQSIKRKIKTILKYLGIYNKSIWPKLTKRKIQYLVNNIKIKSSIETLNDIRATIENKQKGAYMRFGDGDIYLMLGKDEMLNKASKKLAKEMKEAVKCDIGICHIALPIHSNLFGFENGMIANMHLVSDNNAINFLSATYKNIDINKIYTPVALHYVATFNPEFCINFLQFLKSTNPIFVGNHKIETKLINKLFGNTHIKTPSVNSYSEIDRIEDELVEQLKKNGDKFQVVVIAMGCPGRVLQKRILKKGFNVYLFDFGSLLDAFNNDNTRLWIDLAGGTDKLKNIINNIN